jgi:hypothetical protein
VSKTTNKHTPLPWVVELNPTIPEGIQVAAFETTEEMAGNRHLQIIIRSHNPDADAELIVKAVNNYDKLRDECDALRAECDALRAKTSMSIGVGDGTGSLFVHGDYDSIKRVQALIFECEKLRKDAERYRWLRGNGSFAPSAFGGWALACGLSRYSSVELDASVDSAMKAAEHHPECGCCGQTDRCDDDCDAVVIGGHRPAEQQSAPVFHDEDHVSIPRNLIAAACSAIDKKRDGTKTLAELRRYTFGDLSKQPAPEVAMLVEVLSRCRHQASYSIGGEDALKVQLEKVRDIVSETLHALAAMAAQRNQGGE